MFKTLLAILVVILVFFIAFKVFKSIVKGIIILLVIVLAIMLFNSVSNSTFSLQKIKAFIPPQLEQQGIEREINKIAEKIKGFDTAQVEKYIENIQSELEKRGLSIESVKKVLDRSAEKEL
ncbi:MAG TPA: hypothetical protein GXX46_03910 [Peptococcaceae bacterium]|nr:hypothetical protein [Peptococcaceae bacterium]